MSRGFEVTLFLLQAVQVLFLLLHDWVPLGRLSDLEAGRSLDSLGKRIRAMLINGVPYALGLAFFCAYLRAPHLPGWVQTWLVWSYGILFAGELWAWWIPYLVRPDPARAARYQVLFGRTHSFLPSRNGITPNTLHCVLHLATLSTLLLLWRL